MSDETPRPRPRAPPRGRRGPGGGARAELSCQCHLSPVYVSFFHTTFFYRTQLRLFMYNALQVSRRPRPKTAGASTSCPGPEGRSLASPAP